MPQNFPLEKTSDSERKLHLLYSYPILHVLSYMYTRMYEYIQND